MEESIPTVTKWQLINSHTVNIKKRSNVENFILKKLQLTKQRETHVIEHIPTATKWQPKIRHPATNKPPPQNQVATITKSNHQLSLKKPLKPINRKLSSA